MREARSRSYPIVRERLTCSSSQKNKKWVAVNVTSEFIPKPQARPSRSKWPSSVVQRLQTRDMTSFFFRGLQTEATKRYTLLNHLGSGASTIYHACSHALPRPTHMPSHR